MFAGRRDSLFKFNIHLFLLISITYLLFASGFPWLEADSQFKISQSLVQHHSLSVAGKTGPTGIIGRNGRYYDRHGFTNVLLFVPIAMCEVFLKEITNKYFKYFFSFLEALTGVMVNSLVCLVFFSTLFLFGIPLEKCFYTTLCLAFLTIVFPYSATSYEGNLDMLFVLSALYFLFKYRKNNSIFSLICSGAFTGLSINTRDFSMIFLCCISLFVLWISLRERTIKTTVIFLIGLFPFLVLWGYYNWLRTGFYYLSPIALEVLTGKCPASAPTDSVVRGLKALLFSQGGSIFLYSPILIFSIIGWRKFFSAKKEECVLVLAISVLFLLANAKLPQWFGLWSWGPRYTLTITPLLMLPLGYYFMAGKTKNRLEKYAFIVICAYSLLVQLAGTLTGWHDRIGYLLARKGGNAFLFTAKYSQWWDGIKTLCIYNTISTWWNRLIFKGIPPIFIGIYLVSSLIIICYSLIYIKNFIESH